MNSKNKALVILNTFTLAITLFANYVAGSGKFSKVTVAGVSHQYDTLFAPAGYAFIIWSLIFLCWVGFVVYQWILLRGNDQKEFIKRTGLWFAVSNIANAAWLYCWTNEWLGWSVILILVLLLSLCILTINLRLELDDEPGLVILFVWWPVVFYLGWMMVATIACIAAWLVYTGWQGGLFTPVVWTIIMIAIATIIYLVLIYKRNLREAAMIGAWAFIAIAVRQWHSYQSIAVTALAAAIVLLIAAFIHGYKNRKMSITVKIKKHEW